MTGRYPAYMIHGHSSLHVKGIEVLPEQTHPLRWRRVLEQFRRDLTPMYFPRLPDHGSSSVPVVEKNKQYALGTAGLGRR